jgi:hypothetical protein
MAALGRADFSSSGCIQSTVPAHLVYNHAVHQTHAAQRTRSKNPINPENIVPVFLVIAIAVVAAFFLVYRHKTRAQVQETIRSALSQGAQLTPELIQVLGEPAAPKNSDLRRGIILLFCGIALFICGIIAAFMGRDEGGAAFFMVISTFPLLVGLAYLLLWKFTHKTKDE